MHKQLEYRAEIAITGSEYSANAEGKFFVTEAEAVMLPCQLPHS